MDGQFKRFIRSKWVLLPVGLLALAVVAGILIVRNLLPGITAKTTPVPIPRKTGGETAQLIRSDRQGNRSLQYVCALE